MDIALIIIGRTAGEDQDSKNQTGSYLLTKEEVVQVYVEAPQGKLGKPTRSLVGFAKTNIINPGESEKVTVNIPKYYIASYDDSGVTGYKSSYILEEGIYTFHVGSDIRNTTIFGEYNQEFIVVERLEEVYAPITSFERIKAVINEEDNYEIAIEKVPTIKHLCANNQEASRRMVDSIVSERTLREIYLRGFEIAVKECKAKSVMTTYNPENDNVKEKLELGEITRSDLQRNAKNILKFIMASPIMLHELGRISDNEVKEINVPEDNGDSSTDIVYYEADKETNNIIIDGSNFNNKKGSSEVFGLTFNKLGEYVIEITMKSGQGELAQLPLSVYYDNVLKETITIRGTEGQWITERRELGGIWGLNHYIKLYFGANGLDIDKIVIRCK